MYDLRYITDDGCNIIETYTPSKLYGCKNVSVSGIDVSRDKREILISYENDVVGSIYISSKKLMMQSSYPGILMVSYSPSKIYTFPIFPGIKSAAGPTLDDLDERSLCSGSLCAQERASYGAHLNRLTFLKVSITVDWFAVLLHLAVCILISFLNLVCQICRSHRRVYMYRVRLRTCLDLRKGYGSRCCIAKSRSNNLQRCCSASLFPFLFDLRN